MERGSRAVRKRLLEYGVLEKQRSDGQKLDSELFAHFAAESVLDALPRLDSSARQRPLPGKDAPVRRHPAEKDAPLPVVHDRNDDEAGSVGRSHREREIVAAVSAACCERAVLTEIVEIPNRGHALTIDSGWREVADTALAFIRRFV